MHEATSLLTPDHPEWDEWLHQAPHDFYHLAAYHALSERTGEGRAYMLVHGNSDQFLAWPYLLRELDDEHTDGTSVYGYSGPTGRGLEDERFLASAWSELRTLWSAQRLVTIFTRFHPLLENDRFCRGFHGADMPAGGEVIRFGRSVSIDLSLDQDERRAQYPQPLRQEIKRAERLGLVVELDKDWTHFPYFIKYYRETMKQSGATDRYLFSDSYFNGLRRSLSGIGHLAVAKLSEEPVAALIFTAYGRIASAHLTGANAAFTGYSPLKCLIDYACEFSRTLGADQLHLGAGRGGMEDSLFDFKARFSPLRHHFLGGRWILDREMNTRMSQRLPADQLVGDGFFPTYRTPVPRREASP